MNESQPPRTGQFAISCLGLTVASVLAQSAPAVPASRALAGLEPRVVPIHTMVADRGVDYGLWAAGADYKASFHAGVEFVPYLGREYAENQSFRWRTLSVRLGERELVTRSPRLSHTARRAEYDLGGVVEAYDVRLDGLEQTFVIAQPPDAVGDLVIRGRVNGPLTAQPAVAGHAAVTFRAQGGADVVTYGAATAVDAVGDRCPMTTAVDGSELTLRLAGDWLETATFPVVVDPLIGVFFGQNSSQALGVLDVVCTEPGADNVWVAFERWASASDSDLRQYRDGVGSAALGYATFSDITASWSTISPSLGWHERQQVSVLAFARVFAGGDCKVRFHRHELADLTLSTAVAPVDTGARHGWRPDVVSVHGPTNTSPLVVVFQVEDGPTFAPSATSAVWASAIDLATAPGTAATAFRIADSTIEDYERPNAAAMRDGSGHFVVAWQAIGNGPASPHTDWDVQLRRVHVSGAADPVQSVHVGNGQHELGPHVAGFDGDVFLAAMRARIGDVGGRPAGVNGHRVLTRPVEWLGTGFAIGPGDVHYGEVDPRLTLGGFDFDRQSESHALFTVRSSVTDNLYLRLVGFNARLVREEQIVTTPFVSDSVGGVGYERDGFVISYERRTANAVQLDKFELLTVLPTPSGTGCSTATLEWRGSQIIGDEDCPIVMDNLPAGALGAVLIAFAPFAQPLTGVPLVESGCWLNVPNSGPSYVGMLPFGVGPTITYEFDLPEWLDPGPLYFQGVHFNALATRVLTTQRLFVQLIK